MLYITLRQYEYVLAIAEAGSLSAAAQALNVSQPSMSVALSAIEDRIGATLFVRKRGTPLTITPEGRRFARQAEALLRNAARIEASAVEGEAQVELRLGCFQDVAPRYLASALRLLGRALPDVTVLPQVGSFATLIDGLQAAQIDLCVTYDLGLDARFDRVELLPVVPHIFVAPGDPLAARSDIALADISRRGLILSDEGLSMQHMLSLFRSAGQVPTIAHRATTLEVMRSLAAHGFGVGVSYSVPAGTLSYDGQPLRHVPIRDTAAVEPLIVAQIGRPKPGSLRARATEVLQGLK